MESPSSDRIGFFVILLSCVAALGGFLFGFDSGVINGTVSALRETFQSSQAGSGFNVASMLLGCAVGAFFAGRIADWLGRRPALLTAAVCFGVSAWGSGVASSSFEFVIYRLVGGLAVGGASVISPAYISEIAPAAFRGRLASLQQMAIVLGLFAAFLSNYLLANAGGGATGALWGFQTWQWMFWVELIPVALFFIGLLLIPESPRFLVTRGKPNQAEAVLSKVDPSENAAEKVALIQGTLNSAHRPSLRDVLEKSSGRMAPVVWVGIVLAALQQLVGINVIFYYGAVLWEAAGFTEENALLINVIGGAVNIGSTIVAISLIDRIGRKPLLIMGSVGMAVFLGVMAVVFSQADVGASDKLLLNGPFGILALVSANLYIVFFAISWGPVMWVLLGEMFPNQMRGAALSLAGLSQWGVNFAVTMTFPVLLRTIGLGGSYGLYAMFALASVFFSIKFIRETKGKTLEEMEA